MTTEIHPGDALDIVEEMGTNIQVSNTDASVSVAEVWQTGQGNYLTSDVTLSVQAIRREAVEVLGQ